MKTLIISLFLIIQVYHGVSSSSVSIMDYDAVESRGDSRVCRTGLVAYLPETVKPPVACTDPYEIYTCAYGEGRCDGRLFCGTPPCTWRCWCHAPFKRDANGKCTLFCPVKAETSLNLSAL